MKLKTNWKRIHVHTYQAIFCYKFNWEQPFSSWENYIRTDGSDSSICMWIENLIKDKSIWQFQSNLSVIQNRRIHQRWNNRKIWQSTQKWSSTTCSFFPWNVRICKAIQFSDIFSCITMISCDNCVAIFVYRFAIKKRKKIATVVTSNANE